MTGSDIVPALPPNAITETNRETLVRLKQDLKWISDGALSAGDENRMFAHDEHGQPFWGYLVESALVDNTREIFVLMRNIEGLTRAAVLRWMPMERVHTRKNAQLLYKVVDADCPAEDVVCEILRLLQDAFEYAVEDNWSYAKRMGFYHAFPFEELVTTEKVVAFRPILFSCPAFVDSMVVVPDSE
mmetsp:Transcript_1161/g.1777  ORF Transcript_1161/g.1777 Transcript_1161/m.1777 type:complete len:186 (+) Transcript_1161:169-726(+)